MSSGRASSNQRARKAITTEMGTGDAASSEGLSAEELGLVKGTSALTSKAVLSTSSLHGKLSQERTSVFSVC